MTSSPFWRPTGRSGLNSFAMLDSATKFRCPNCEAEYKVVRVAAPDTFDVQLLCLSCGAPLHNREGKFLLKYFRTERSGLKHLTGHKPKLR